ncbi:MAG: hypothetical protein Kow001_22080 [Acidobacteriota bacterium]
MALTCSPLPLSGLGEELQDRAEIESRYREGLDRLAQLRRQVQHVHPFLNRLYPVVVVEGQHLYAFEPDAAGERFELTADGPVPMPIPTGVRAAFPLELLEGRPACVVTGEVFDSLEGYATIFHEFVHCRQMELGEMQLKQGLRVYQEAMSRSDPMWELNHPFPYGEKSFESLYSEFLAAAADGEPERVGGLRLQLRELLASTDYEYMVWQEWKEGLARLIENLVRLELKLPTNRGGLEPPFTRVTFYAGGEAFIRFLTGSRPEWLTGIERLLEAMRDWPVPRPAEPRLPDVPPEVP